MRAAALTATAPTEWARRLVRGAYDLHVIITHPEFPQQDMGLADQVALARQGAFLER